jgi:hypothetical protein
LAELQEHCAKRAVALGNLRGQMDSLLKVVSRGYKIAAAYGGVAGAEGSVCLRELIFIGYGL